MKQQCHLSMIWLSWIVYLGGLACSIYWHLWILAVVWLVVAPLVQWQYIRRFPAVSSLMGYGAIADAPAAVTPRVSQTVRLYTALGCPFCPLLEQRLENLRGSMEFTLEKIDVTLRPNLLASKGICAVPAVEIHGRILTGMVSSRDLAAAIVQSEVGAHA